MYHKVKVLNNIVDYIYYNSRLSKHRLSEALDMVICFECSRETKEQLNELLSSGKYSGLSEVVAVAVANQLVLTKSAGGEPVVHGAREGDMQILNARTSHPTDSVSLRVHRIPPFFVLKPDYRAEPIASPPQPVRNLKRHENVSQAHWIFGQHNKLLPVKASCRGIANLLADTPTGIEVEEAARMVATQATDLGAYLQSIDDKFNRVRDDMLSTAFPGRSDPDKGRIRYANQFVSGMTKQGQLTGLLVDLGLLNRVTTDSAKVSLTEAGWRLAQLPNPVLDGQAENPIAKFSPEERGFLASHIESNVVVERSAYLQILGAIHSGHDTPEGLRAAFNKVERETTKNKLYFSTQRAGAISRMVDLGLLRRDRVGTRVTYAITENGAAFLNSR